jgi:hypothetical protein
MDILLKNLMLLSDFYDGAIRESLVEKNLSNLEEGFDPLLIEKLKKCPMYKSNIFYDAIKKIH